jgi:DDE superfamily endonuclease
MEEVLDVYQQKPDRDEPLVCMDEASKQLLSDEVAPLALERGKPLRQDYHYRRNGTRALFMFFAPHLGWRRVSSSAQRTRRDWAQQIKRLIDVDFLHARRITLVCDNLNTHHIASLYETFTPAEAHRLARKLRIVHTPRNGSWLNVAEIELSVLGRDCLSRRLGGAAELDAELGAWEQQRNRDGSKVRWQFTTADARTKLRRLYPQH